MITRTLAFLLFLLFLTSTAMAQSVQQSGSVTPGHAAAWLTNGVIQDAGTAASGKFTSIGTTGQGPTICANSAPISQPYVALCLAANTGSKAIISLQNYGGDSAQSLAFDINGTVYDFPYTVGGIVGPNSSAVGDIAVWNNTAGSLLKDVAPTQIFGTQTANTVFAGPTSGGAANPVFRAVVSADLTSALTTPPAIGGTTPAAGAFTTLSASSTVSGAGITALFASPPAIGGTVAAAGAFASLTDTGVTGSTQCIQANSSGVFSGAGVPCVGSINVQSNSYQIAASDCNGIVVETGAFKTITLPASLVGFPANCPIRIVNVNTSRAQQIVGAPANSPLLSGCGSNDYCLQPTLSFDVNIVSSAWSVTRGSGFWHPNAGPTVFVDASSGSDNNDCLASGSAACATFTQALLFVCSIQPPTSTVTISFTGTLHNFVWGGCGTPRIITVTGTGTAVVDDNGAASTVFECDDICVMIVNGGFTIKTTANGSTGLVAQRSSTMDVTGVTFTTTVSNSSGSFVFARDHSNISLNGSMVYTGGGTIGSFLSASRAATIAVTQTQTVSGSYTVTASCSASSGSVIDMSAATFSGGTFTGNNIAAITAGGVITPANCPGTNTSAVSPGWTQP